MQRLMPEWRQASVARRAAAGRTAIFTPALLALTCAWIDTKVLWHEIIWVALGILCLVLGAGSVAIVRSGPRFALAVTRIGRALECSSLLVLAIALDASGVALAVAAVVLGGVALGVTLLPAPMPRRADADGDVSPDSHAEVSAVPAPARPQVPPPKLASIPIEISVSPPSRGVETAAFSRFPGAGPQLPEFDDSVLGSAAGALARDLLASPRRARDHARHLLAELDPALRAGPLALVSWLGAFAFVNQSEHIDYDPAELAARFEAAGFAPVVNLTPPTHDPGAIRLWLIGSAIGHWRASQRLPVAFGRTVLKFGVQRD